MGGGPTTTTKDNTQTQSQPWAPAVPAVTGLLGQLQGFNNSPSGAQTGAVNSLVSNASAIPNFGPQATNSANALFGGGGANQFAPIQQDAYSKLQGNLSPFTNPANLNPFSTPGFSDAYATMGRDISNNVNDRFAAAGRDLSPGNTTALARGLSEGQGGLIANQYNANAAHQIGASNSLFGAGQSTAQGLTGFNQMGNQNMLAGAGLAGQIPGLSMQPGQAYLQAANLQHNLPLANMGGYESLLTPLAALGMQGTSNGTQTKQTTTDPWQQALGLGLAGASLFAAPATGGASLSAMGGLSSFLGTPGSQSNPGSFGWG